MATRKTITTPESTVPAQPVIEILSRDPDVLARIVEMAALTRAAQIDYFRNGRTWSQLGLAKQRETQLDQLIRSVTKSEIHDQLTDKR